MSATKFHTHTKQQAKLWGENNVTELKWNVFSFGARQCKAIPEEALYSPTSLREIEAPKFPDSQHMNVARLSALLTGRIYP